MDLTGNSPLKSAEKADQQLTLFVDATLTNGGLFGKNK